MLDELEHRLRAARQDLPTPGDVVKARVQEKALRALEAATTAETAPRGFIRTILRRIGSNSGRRRQLGRLVATAAVAVVAGAVLGISIWPGPPGARATTGPYPGPTFVPLKAWTTVAVAPGSGEPAGFAPLAWATNVPVSGQTTPFSIFPLSGSDLSNLRPDGVLIVAWLGTPSLVPAPPNPDYPDRTLPLQITDANVRPSWEGQPRRDIPEYFLNARVKQQWVDVRVYFGTQNPSGQVRRSAQEALDRLTIPEP